MSDPSDAVQQYDVSRAEEVNQQFHAANEMYQTNMWSAVQIVLLQDIRFHLHNIEEILRNR